MNKLTRITVIFLISVSLTIEASFSQQFDSSQFQPLPPTLNLGSKTAHRDETFLIVSLPKLDPQDRPPLPDSLQPPSEHLALPQVKSAPANSPKQGELLPGLENEFSEAYQQFSLGKTAPVVREITSRTNLADSTEIFKLPSSYQPAKTTSKDQARELVAIDNLKRDSVRDDSGIRSSDSLQLPYHDLQMEIVDGNNLGNADDPLWWQQGVLKTLQPGYQTEPVDIHSLVYLAIKNSPRIQAISQVPLMREFQVIEADSAFDAVGFVRSSFNDRNDPVGNTLVTGGPPFLEDHIWNGDFGIRRKTRTGANVELGQKLGFQNSNSQFFLPQDQGTATLALNVSQPLLRGRGRFVNESQILIAQANSGAAWDTFSNELQDELQQLAQAYWRLYYDRSLFLQKRRSVERGQQILSILEGRQDLDSLPSQIARAKSAVESRKTELINAFRDVKNSETEIRRRIADRDWRSAQAIELLPSESPSVDPVEIPVEDIVQTGLEHRREIKEAMQRAQAAAIHYEIGENELLPELSLLLGGYVSALNGDSGVLNSWNDQFNNRPGYNAGINFEMPYGNRAARSQLSQRKLQLTKIRSEVEEAIQLVIAETQIASRRVNSAIQTRKSALVAIEAAQGDLFQQSRRWELFGLVEGDFAEGQNPVILLNQVLDAQERLAAAELIYAQAELELKTAEIGLQRSMGTLLMMQNVNLEIAVNHDTLNLNLNQFGN